MARVTFALFALFIMIAAHGQHGARAQQSADIEAVKAVHEAFHEAMSNEDIELMSQIWIHDNSARLIPPNSVEILVGWEAAKTAYQGTFANVEMVSLSMKDVEVFAGPEFAWIVDVHELQMRPTEDGPLVSATVLSTSVYRKVDDSWLLTHIHASPIAQPTDQ